MQSMLLIAPQAGIHLFPQVFGGSTCVVGRTVCQFHAG